MNNEKPEDDRITRIKKRLIESSLAREGPLMQAARNDAMFMGRILAEDVPLRGHNYFLINKTGPAVIAHAQIQMEQKPRISITPRESSVEPEYWMSRKALMTVKSLIDTGAIQMEVESAPTDELGLTLAGEEEAPIEVESRGFVFEDLTTNPEAMAFRVTPAFVQQVMPLFGNWPPENPVNMPVLKPTDLIPVDDTTTARVLENMQKIDWDRDDNDVWLMENVINNNKFGWQGAICSWDKQKFLLTVRDLNIKNLYMPPEATNVQTAEYVIARELISKDAAKKKYPEAAAKIDEYCNSDGGPPQDGFGMGDEPYINSQFQRPMLYIYHEWNRNTDYPMTEAEAVDQGRAVLRDGAYFLTDDEYEVTGEVTAPDSKNWPKRLGIQYTQVIAQQVVLDTECPYVDIPIPYNKNIPMSYRPYGQGEPERLWFIQKFIDKLASILIDHLTYYRSPQQIYPWSVYKKLYGREQIHSFPGRDLFLEDGVFERYRDFFQSGKGFTVDAPKMTTGYTDLWLAGMKIHDELSGNVQVLQGRSPGSDTSGKALETLQTAARGMIGFKAFQTENMLKQLARLRIDAHRKFLPLFMWEKMNDKYPAEVLAAIRERSRNMEFDVAISVASGGGELREAKKEQVRLDAGAGLVSPEYARKELEYDDVDKQWINPATQVAAAPPQSSPPPKEGGSSKAA